MPFFDLPLEQLERYLPERSEPDDFDAFWKETLQAVHEYPLDAHFVPVDFGLRLVRTYSLTFNGFAGQPINGWLLLPHDAEGTLPAIVQYIGYGGGRSFPTEWLDWAVAGYAHFVMDTRGQGSANRSGDTPDLEIEPGSPQFPGFMTRGILSPQTYYYRRLFTDAVRAVEAALSHPLVDSERIAVAGGSQGGGIALAVAGLMRDTVKVALPDVPFLCHYRRATQIVDTMPYAEIANFCKTHRDKVETVFNTLSYFDGINFAARATAKALFSVGLMDTICPPSTVYAAYNHYAGDKRINVYEYNNHEGGGIFHGLERIRFVNDLWR